MLAVYRKSPAPGRGQAGQLQAHAISNPDNVAAARRGQSENPEYIHYFGNLRQPSTLKQIPVLVRFCVAALVHAVGNGECPHIFEPEVSDCAAWRGTGDLVDSYGRFRDALQCCGEMNPRAFSTLNTCVDRHIGHQQRSFSPHEARNTAVGMPLENQGLLSNTNSRVQPKKSSDSPSEPIVYARMCLIWMPILMYFV